MAATSKKTSTRHGDRSQPRFHRRVPHHHQQLRCRVRRVQRRPDQRHHQIRHQSFHGNAFDFLRNTDLDARNYFSPTRGAFRQNQFGGTFGGPIRRDKLFFFVDYQGTRQTQGIDTGNISVPSNADRTGKSSLGLHQRQSGENNYS
jgi:hypothetical protein